MIMNKDNIRDRYMLCCGCGLAHKVKRMFIKEYENTGLCLCRKCANELEKEIKEFYLQMGVIDDDWK